MSAELRIESLVGQPAYRTFCDYPQPGLTNHTPGGYDGSVGKNYKKQILDRLHRIEGQVRGVIRMVERGEYCVPIIHQSLAVKEALLGVENLLLENHLATHVVEQMKKGQKAKAVKEILAIYKLSKKK